MIICLVGPTGVGKTKLSIMLSKWLDAAVVNADACQIYKGLDIGSAKITKEEMGGIKHYLLDIKEPNEEYSVFDYQKDARLIFEKLKDKNIVLTGGTGLYIKSALFNYHFSPLSDEDYSNYTNKELYEMCLNIDKNLNIHENNRRRLENYLKRIDKRVEEPTLLYDKVLFIGLKTEREVLYERINKRVDEMIANGLVEEVKYLYQKYGKTKILSRAIGYKEIIQYLDGEISLEEAINLIKKNSRHYAKRQFTWFNNQMDIQWFDTDFNDFNKTFKEVQDYIKKNLD